MPVKNTKQSNSLDVVRPAPLLPIAEASVVAGKRKREASGFALYFKENSKNFEGTGSQKMAACASAYREQKQQAPIE